MVSIKRVILNIMSKEINWRTKDESVNIKDVDLKLHVGSIGPSWVVAFGETELVITSGKDSEHSKKSLHYTGKAIDIRIWTFRELTQSVASYKWWCELEYACLIFANNLGPEYSVVLEKDHIHLQLGKQNIREAEKGLGKHKNLWIAKR